MAADYVKAHEELLAAYERIRNAQRALGVSSSRNPPDEDLRAKVNMAIWMTGDSVAEAELESRKQMDSVARQLLSED